MKQERVNESKNGESSASRVLAVLTVSGKYRCCGQEGELLAVA